MCKTRPCLFSVFYMSTHLRTSNLVMSAMTPVGSSGRLVISSTWRGIGIGLRLRLLWLAVARLLRSCVSRLLRLGIDGSSLLLLLDKVLVLLVHDLFSQGLLTLALLDDADDSADDEKEETAADSEVDDVEPPVKFLGCAGGVVVARLLPTASRAAFLVGAAPVGEIFAYLCRGPGTES